MKFIAAYVRVYYNRGRDTAEKIWSVDFGPNSVELLASSVYVNARGGTNYDHEVGQGGVRAWMFYTNVVVEFVDTAIRITTAA